MLRRVEFVRTGVSEERISIISVARIDDLGTLAVCLGYWSLVTLFLTGWFLYPDDGGDIFLRNASSYKIHTA
jgi:hypothetical protein